MGDYRAREKALSSLIQVAGRSGRKQDARVFIQLQGSCVGCSASSSTLKYIVEKELKSAIHPDLDIVNVPHGMEDKLEEL